MSDEVAVAPVQTDDTILTGDADTSTPDENSSTPVEGNTGDTGTSTEGSTDVGGKKTEENVDTVPEAYADFTMPEGVELDQSALDAYSPVFKELGLTQEQAQKLVDLRAGEIQAGSDRQVEAFNQLKQEWVDQVKSDKEIGGDNFEENVGLARAALDKLGTPELKELLSDHGVGSHVEIVRFMSRVGRLTQEDSPGNNQNAVTPEHSQLDRLYPKSA